MRRRGSRRRLWSEERPLPAGTETCIAAFLLLNATEDQAREALARLELAADTPTTYRLNQSVSQAKTDVEKFASVLDVMVLVNAEKRFYAASLAFCNGLASRFNCDRVSLGWLERGYVRLRTISRTERFDRNMAAAIVPPKTKADFAGNQRVTHLRDVCHVPAATIDKIESVQPYQTGYESLASLDALVRVDKHRTLLLCASAIRESGIVHIYHGDKLASTCWGISSRMRMNAAAMGPTPRRADEFRMEVEGKPTILVALKDVPAPMTYVGVLENILKCVANVVQSFDLIV